MQMKRLVACALVVLGCAARSADAGPIVVQPLSSSNTPAQNAAILVNALFAGTAGITVTGVTYTGAAVASGTFSGAQDIVGIDSGILLTSGNVANVPGPNTDSGATGDNGAPGDATLDSLIPGFTTFDASLLRLTFIPDGQTLQFSYVFGSEEYNEYANTAYNDVFGFFVNGQNFALIPGTSTPVAINNLNNGNPGSSGVGPGPCEHCEFYRDNAQIGGLGLDTQLDGLTTVLSFVAPVNPGVENTLLLGIADAGDRVLDSAVFIQGGSIESPGGDPENPVLPEIDEDGNFDFNFFVVQPDTTIYIDPLVAIGYDFVVNSGPLVKSVVIPKSIGDGLYDIYDGLDHLLAGNLPFGTVYDFGAPVGAFSVKGIELSAALDPNNPLAFVTGLTFAGPGAVDLTMTPLTAPANAVPEPSMILMFGLGAGAVAFRRRLRTAFAA
jgi:hypothetical protein